ncbi:unnamed protein product [Lathyrus sativus]|nr:unnamed protein product [Lathyrus sativus]
MMEPKQLSLTSPKLSFLSSSSTPLSFFVSNKLQFLKKPNFSVKLNCSLPKSQFFGRNLGLFVPSHVGGPRFQIGPIRAAVKRRKEMPFDNVIQKDKKLKFVLKVRKLLVSQPDRVMSLQELGKHKQELGLDKNRRLIAVLKRFPGVFEIMEEGCFSLKFKMTSEAESLYLEELRVRNETEDIVVDKLRKLLMMSLEKRILLEKIAHLATDLGLPREFRDTVCHRYPEFFKVVETEKGRALELTHWDPQLAVSAAELSAEDNRIREMKEQNLIIDRAPKFNRVKLPKGLNLSKGEMRKIMQFRDIPYVSPYLDFSMLGSGTPEKEKHACGVIHEILSLTLEKRILVDHLTHFRDEFRFSQQLRGMLIRHPDMFYISLKGDRDSVFLREAYRDSQLVYKDRLLLLKEKLRSLVDIPRFPKGRRGAAHTRIGDGTEENDIDNRQNESGDEEQEWSQGDDDGEDNDDDWIDEEDGDDTPPDFDEEEAETLEIEKRKTITHVQDTRQNNERVLDPSLPDGRPRERW